MPTPTNQVKVDLLAHAKFKMQLIKSRQVQNTRSGQGILGLHVQNTGSTNQAKVLALRVRAKFKMLPVPAGVEPGK